MDLLDQKVDIRSGDQSANAVEFRMPSNHV